ncbi:MAG: lipase [Gordonia sp.]|uniref:lipase family protein n=1 Tax=Gordonia sp. (in: high G+C Gram-positive bacteria) TaxID=84139 RepID=UPI000C64534D|nr:lipase family protein [Gordonia sp. (in: high G+C Gram-positive bacteria)]MAU83136.1 lipase [Gordonia sp. (in: high G+C Gram-positive bacteria)]
MARVPRLVFLRVLVVLGLALGSMVFAAAPAAIAAPGPGSPLPSADPFYSYSGPLENIAPGTVLRSRPMTFRTPTLDSPITGTQVLYRTTDQAGDGAVTVATVLRPLTPGPTRLVSYHMAYDALGSKCDPSYTLSGGYANSLNTAEQGVIAGYLAAGYTVVAPDYEGEDLEWTIGRQSGYAALDGVRAAQSFLRVPDSTPVGLVGYSGGSVPTQWGAEVAPRYAPELNIVGTAAGGLPVDLAHNLPYIDGSDQWAGVIPALVVAYQRTYDLDVDSFLSTRGKQTSQQVSDECIVEFAGNYPGLTSADMVKPPYSGLLDVPEVVRAVNDNIMGTAGTPRSPLFLAVGHSDAIGDTIMVTGDVAGLAHEYCTRGVDVTYAQYDGRTHGQAFPVFEAQALPYLTDRFNGVPTRSNCATIPRGNSLAPMAVP